MNLVSGRVKRVSKKKEKNNKIIIGTTVCLVALLAIIGIFKLNKEVNDTMKKTNESINLGVKEKRLIEDEEYLLLTNYEDYKMYFDDDKVKKEDFNSNNYLLIQSNYDSCSEEDLKIDNYSFDNNSVTVKFTYKAKCGLCAPRYIYNLVKLDKKITDPEVKIEYKAINDPECDDTIAYKPMIYLYPEKEINIKVKLGNEKYLTTTYPKYKGEWNVRAYPSGKLIDNNTGRELYGLYWEGNNHIAELKSEGFVIKGEDTISFLEEKLEVLGLNEREANEFIVFWLPKLEVNNYNYIRFETKEEIDTYMPLAIDPKPTSIIRILMDFKPLDKKIEVEEQQLKTPYRTGYTVVEWGGSLIK